MINEMMHEINDEIEFLKENYERTNEHDPIGNARLQGMIRMLQIASGKKYFYDANGLHERN